MIITLIQTGVLAGTAMAANPLGAALAIGGAILGKIGMNKKRREERKRRRREKGHALKAQKSLIGSISDIRAEYAEKAGFGRQSYDLQQQQGMLGFNKNYGEASQQVGQSNLAYGGANKSRDLLSQGFQNENKSRNLAYKENFAGLERQYEGDLRGIQTGLLDIERTAANRGYEVGSKTINTNSNIGGYK